MRSIHDEAEAVTELAQSWRERDEREAEAERDYLARRHFPHLRVAPRESDEYPTFWEDQ